MAASRIIDLRKLLAERFPQEVLPAADRLVTGISVFDQTLEGGIPKGSITEVTSASLNAGSASLIAALLQRARQDRFSRAD